MRLNHAVLLLVALAVPALSACNRSLNAIAPRSPQQLPAAPVDPVTAGQLPPPGTAGTNDSLTSAPADVAPTAPGVENTGDQQVAAVEPTGEPPTREGVSGSWNVASDNPQCRMILAFTKWSGGYRAATKRCTSPELASVSAWDVKGQQVVLMDGGGNTVARLYQSGSERYDGTTNSGQAISFSR